MISPELSLMWLQLAITLQSKKLYCVSIKWTNLLNYICKVALKFPLKNIYKMLRMNIISALKQVEIYYHLYLHERFTLDRNSLYLAYFNANVFIWFQLVAAISVSTGCLSYGICMAYTSSAIPSMLSPNVTSPLAIESSSDMNEMLAYSSWMSKLPRKFRTFSEYLTWLWCTNISKETFFELQAVSWRWEPCLGPFRLFI